MNQHPMDLFLSACGLAGPLQLHVSSPAGQEAVHLTLAQPFAVVGSNAGNDLALNHVQISRRHAYLQALAGRIFCLDLKSRTGIRWEGRPARYGWIDPGQAVGIGPYQVRVEFTPSPQPLSPWEGERGKEYPPQGERGKEYPPQGERGKEYPPQGERGKEHPSLGERGTYSFPLSPR
ncbi:MAG TPA: FHA domain-containing protein, partial [Gemmataceae bacterium]|nr:FHA domain-containing protein [Gemmataceae bacterium]